MNKVSIIVPVYNSEIYLERCINSILSQTYRNFELILINDGSSDRSLEILKKYERLDNRVKVVNNPNQGVSKTRNIGIDIANGEYIQFIDSDDFIEVNMIEEMLTEMIEKDLDMIMTGIFLDIESNNKVSTQTQTFPENLCTDSYEIAINVLKRLKGTYINSPVNKLYKRSIIKDNKIYMDENIDLGEDIIFNLKYLEKCKKVSFKEKAYYHYWMRKEDSLTSKYRKNKLNNMNLIYDECKNYLLKSDVDANKIKELNSYFIKLLFYCYIDLNANNCDLSFSEKYDYIKSSIKKYKDIIYNSENKTLLSKILRITLMSTFFTIILSKIIYIIKNNFREIIYR